MKIKQILYFCILSFTFINAQQVNISSDEMKANEENKTISFIGNAIVKQNQNIIKADKIIVYFNDNNKTKEYKAINNVKFEFVNDTSHYKGVAQKVIYQPLKSIYTLKGNAKIDDIINKRVIKGDEIVLDMQTGNAKVKGSAKKPVKFIFEMENKK